MKRRLLVITTVVVLLMAFAAPALASGFPPGPPTPDGMHCGAEYGLHHAEMAQMRMLGRTMNPGMHYGAAGMCFGIFHTGH